MDESLEIVNHIYKDSEMAISTLTKLSNTLEKKDNKIKDTVEDIIKGLLYSFDISIILFTASFVLS